MSYVLVGSTYIGTGTLPSPIAGYEARDTTTGDLYVSNTSATAWTLIGNANQTNLGLGAVSGFTATGAIAGATGWAPNDSPNFTTSAKLNGIDLATTNDLANTSTTILNGLAPKITQAIAATSAAVSVKSNIAMGSGMLFCADSSHTVTIPLPYYPDGTRANQADCKWWVGLAGTQTQGQGSTTWWPIGETASSFHTSLIFSADPTTTLTFSAYLVTASGNQYGVSLCYGIIGVRQ